MSENEKILEAYEQVIISEARGQVIPLKAKITGMKDGKALKEPYRAVVWQEGNKWMFGIEQSFDGKFTQFSSTGPGWRLSSLLDHGDFIYMDMGQKWGAKGIKQAVKEALKYI